MAKRLLYLDDNGYLLKQTMSFLKEDGFDVIPFYRIDQAEDYMRNNKDGIDCIITDLNMNDEWLGDFREESYGGLLSGWVWLMRFVYADEEFRHIPSIVYSGYISELNDYLKEREEKDLLKKYPVSFIKKGGNTDKGYMALLNKLNELISQ